jgi:hypothetical protein
LTWSAVRRRRAAALLAAATMPALTGCGSRQHAQPTVAAPAVTHPALPGAATLVRGELRGIAQHTLVLGSPRAPVAIIEYADLVCSMCARVHRTVVPEVIRRYVRTGEASLEFRSIASAPRSRNLALGAYAASTQHRGWDFVQLAYLRSSVAQDSSARLALALGLDVPRWRRDLRQPEWPSLIQAALSVVRVARFAGDPVFLVRRRGTERAFIVLTQPSSVVEFEDAIAQALRTHA